MTEVEIKIAVTHYHHDESIPTSVDRAAVNAANAFRDQYEDVLKNILQRTDFNRVSRLAKQLRQLRRESNLHGPFGLHHVFEVRLVSGELFEELERSGLLAFLCGHGSHIRRFVSRDTLPAIEAALASRHEIDEMLCRTRESDVMKSLSETRRLRRADAEESARIIAMLVSRDESTKSSDGRYASRWPRRMRLFSATGKLVLGSAFAAANVTLGTLAGVVTVLPTLTLGSVSAALGVAGSTYTGLNLSLEAIKEFAATLEEE